MDHFAAAGFANATAAYKQAGYTAKGGAAVACASRLLARANVAAAVQAERDKLAKKLDITKERVLDELAAMAFYDAGDLVLPDPKKADRFLEIKSPRDIRKLPERLRKCITGWSWDRHGRFILKLANKQGSLELIGRHLAMWVDRKEVRIGDLAKASDQELDAAIADSARQIAEAEGVPVETVLAQIREANQAAGDGEASRTVH